jgi:hypothetical protein
MTGMADLLSRVRIGDIYTALTAAEPRHSGANRWRARATWRGGDGWSVQLDDSRGVWHDFVTDDRGGVLDLIRRVRGGSRYDALRWLAVYAGVPLDDRPLSQDERERWAEERRRVERDLPTARYWRDTVVRLAEETRDVLKAALFDPTLPWPEENEIYQIECVLSRLRRIGGAELVQEYSWWRERYPYTTALMVRVARENEEIDVRALCRYLSLPASASPEYLRMVRRRA